MHDWQFYLNVHKWINNNGHILRMLINIFSMNKQMITASKEKPTAYD